MVKTIRQEIDTFVYEIKTDFFHKRKTKEGRKRKADYGKEYICSSDSGDVAFEYDLLGYDEAFLEFRGKGIWAKATRKGSNVFLYLDLETKSVELVAEGLGKILAFDTIVMMEEINFEDDFITLSLLNINTKEYIFQNITIEGCTGWKVIDGCLFVMESGEIIKKLNTQTGVVEWTYQCEENEEFTDLIRHDGKQLYLDILYDTHPNSKAFLLALDLSSGEQLWKKLDLDGAIIDANTGNLFNANGLISEYLAIDYKTGDVITNRNFGLEEKSIYPQDGAQHIDGDYLYFVSEGTGAHIGRINIRTHELDELQEITFEDPKQRMGQRAEIVGVRGNKVYVWCTNYIFQIFEFV